MNFDNQKQYKKLDPNHVGKSIELLPDQMRQVLNNSRLIKIPKEYKSVNKIVVNGMGGSNLGARLIQSAFKDVLKVPLLIEPGYAVPNYVDKNTLYIISSYSGTTEEPLSTYKEVQKRKAKILGITENSSKSKLLNIMLKDNIPGFTFVPEFNPSGQPRLGLGYSIFGQLIMIAKSGLLKLQVQEMENIIAELEIRTRKLRPQSPMSQNIAKRITDKIINKTPILIGAEFLNGNLHIIRNQINECSKSFCTYLDLPELNHYAMEGLVFPKSNPRQLIAVFFDSNFYHPKIILRSKLTKQVVKKNKIEAVSCQLGSKNKLTQNFELLQLGAWISYYLGIAYQVDTAAIPYVDWFKKALKK